MLNKIEIVRGTTNTIQIKVYDANGAEYDLGAGERLVFGIKKRAEDDAIIFEKTGQIIGSGLFNVVIAPEDTEGLAFGQYVYDVGIGNGSDFYNVIKASPFVIAPNVTSRGSSV